MQIITITEYSYDIDFQAFINGHSCVEVGEQVLVITLDNVQKLITKK